MKKGLQYWIFGVLIAAATIACGQEPPRPARDTRTYANASWRWSVSYPAGWTIDSSDSALIRIRSEARSALCSIHSGAVDRFNTVDEFTEFMLANETQFFREKGQKFTVLGRKRITLPNRVVGNDVLAGIGAGGKSRRIHVLADGRGFAIDCETYTKNWASVEADYQRVIASFTVRK